MAQYPDTLLRNDPPQQDPDFGGRPSSEWGQPAISWFNSVLMFLENIYLTVTRQPYTTQYVTIQQAVAAGDVVACFPDLAITNARYYAQRYTSGTHVRVLGIALEPASAQATVRIASGGILAASVCGIAATGASAEVGLNASTGRLRVAQAGDVVVGRMDVNANVHFFGANAEVP